jgi:hypothetical protein
VTTFTYDDLDTWDALGQKVHLDTSDYRTWAQTTDEKPVPGKKYTVPNTIHIDVGEFKAWDSHPLAILSVWRSMANRDKLHWEQRGFLVLLTAPVSDREIKRHLGSTDTHGYVFIGHGDIPGTN